MISERIGEQTGYKSISWQEAQEDLLSAITLRNVLMYTIVGAILLLYAGVNATVSWPLAKGRVAAAYLVGTVATIWLLERLAAFIQA